MLKRRQQIVVGIKTMNQGKTIEKIIGKNIKSAKFNKINNEYDDIPYLDLEFEDGTTARIVASYGAYTGHSEDEYPCYIYIEDEDDGDENDD